MGRRYNINDRIKELGTLLPEVQVDGPHIVRLAQERIATALDDPLLHGERALQLRVEGVGHLARSREDLLVHLLDLDVELRNGGVQLLDLGSVLLNRSGHTLLQVRRQLLEVVVGEGARAASHFSAAPEYESPQAAVRPVLAF